MLKKAIGVLIVLSFAFAPVIAFAQMLPEGKWWRDPRVIKRLNLSEDQTEALDKIVVKHSRKLIGLKSAVQQETFELGVLLEDRELNEDAVIKQVDKLEREKAALARQYWRLVLDVKKTIGHDSFMKVKARAEERAQKKMHRFTGREDYRKDKKPPKHPPVGKKNW